MKASKKISSTEKRSFQGFRGIRSGAGLLLKSSKQTVSTEKRSIRGSRRYLFRARLLLKPENYRVSTEKSRKQAKTDGISVIKTSRLFNTLGNKRLMLEESKEYSSEQQKISTLRKQTIKQKGDQTDDQGSNCQNRKQGRPHI